jgi:hypothetical protein
VYSSCVRAHVLLCLPYLAPRRDHVLSRVERVWGPGDGRSVQARARRVCRCRRPSEELEISARVLCVCYAEFSISFVSLCDMLFVGGEKG